VLAKTAK
jgi:hypothetical protein